ncbi:hypothetical protein NU195Hw_Modified_645t1 [Hortaea werneckii]
MDSDDGLSFPGCYAKILNEAYALEKRQKSRAEDVRDHYQRLSSRLGALRQLSSTDRPLGDELLTQLFDDAEGIGKYLAHTLGNNFLNGQPNEASAAKARQVFDVPELLEMILLKLPPSSIFVAQQVCQTFSALITSSPKIQHYLGLKPDLQSNFSTCFNGRSVSPWSRFQCGPEFDSSGRTSAWLSRRLRNIQPEDESKSKTFELLASFSSHSKLPRLSERCQSMLICQPPIYEMNISVACCSDDTSHHLPGMPAPPPNPEPIRSKTGITTWDHDKDGFVCVAPSFKGVVHLKDGDPAMEMQKRWDKQTKGRYEARVYRQRRMSAYVQAKQQAFVAGRSIPTLAEFEAEQ